MWYIVFKAGMFSGGEWIIIPAFKYNEWVKKGQIPQGPFSFEEAQALRDRLNANTR